MPSGAFMDSQVPNMNGPNSTVAGKGVRMKPFVKRSALRIRTSLVAGALCVLGACVQVPAPPPPQTYPTPQPAPAPPPAQAPPSMPAPPASTRAPSATSVSATFKAEEIEALVAPIALYPDSVLSQVLMASTYPLEVVYASRWVKANPNVKGDAAIKAVETQTWDVSVKSLVAFPQVLEPMADKLEWTQKLGDAFLAQQKDVLDAVQRLRAKAQQSGNLKTNEQQKVIVEQAPAASAGQPQTIVKIEPANPQVIYVPTYDPVVVYGAWGYPAYLPYYWPPYSAYYGYYPGAAFASGIAWGIGFAAAGAIFGNCNWGGGDVNIDINRATNIDRNFDRSKVQGGGRWQHDAGHRQGVAYRDNATREKFNRGNVAGAEGRGDFRGRDGAGGIDRGGGDRAGAGDRAGPADRAGAGNLGGAGGARGGGDNAFQGVGGGAPAQRDISRGHSSAGRSFSGGGGRAGGGRGGGGRR